MSVDIFFVRSVGGGLQQPEIKPLEPELDDASVGKRSVSYGVIAPSVALLPLRWGVFFIGGESYDANKRFLYLFANCSRWNM